jgi:hypothetical protein
MEWIKLRSLRSTWLTLAIAVAASAGIALATGSSTTSGGMFVGNTLVGMLVGVLLIGVVGVLAMTSEYTSGTIRATFAAAPRRLRVLAAKAAVVGAVALITGEAAAFLSFFAGCMTLRHGITAPALSQPGVLRAIVLTGASLSLIGLFGLGLGAIIRHTAAAITVVVGIVCAGGPLNLAMPPRRDVMLAVSLERTRNARHLRSHRHGPGRADPRPARCISRRQRSRPCVGSA